MIGTLGWIGFAGGVIMSSGTVIAVMKTFIVPRRSWSLIPWLIGRYAFRLFHGIAIRLRSFDLADRFLGFLAPVVIIGILSSFLASFVVSFALDILAGATGMIFVALTIGYLPTIYGEVTEREILIKQLEGWAGVPSWGPEILAQFSDAGASHQLPTLSVALVRRTTPSGPLKGDSDLRRTWCGV